MAPGGGGYGNPSMTLEESGGSQGTTKLFWWPCPNCRLWHQTRMPLEMLDQDSVEVRCPVNGRLVSRPVMHKRLRGEMAPPIKRGLFSRLFGGRRPA